MAHGDPVLPNSCATPATSISPPCQLGCLWSRMRKGAKSRHTMISGSKFFRVNTPAKFTSELGSFISLGDESEECQTGRFNWRWDFKETGRFMHLFNATVIHWPCTFYGTTCSLHSSTCSLHSSLTRLVVKL